VTASGDFVPMFGAAPSAPQDDFALDVTLEGQLLNASGSTLRSDGIPQGELAGTYLSDHAAPSDRMLLLEVLTVLWSPAVWAIDKDKLAIALKGTLETLNDLFFSNMSERASKIMREDMQAMGPVRLKDVDESQQDIVLLAKDLAARGEIIISEGKGDDELIY
jgi:hypothetical protein